MMAFEYIENQISFPKKTSPESIQPFSTSMQHIQ